MDPKEQPLDGLVGAAMLAASAAVPAWVAASHAGNVADAAYDDGVMRTVGLGWAGAWHALDAPVAGLVAWLPLGTRAYRAGLASALVSGFAGAVLYLLARRLLGACARAPRFGPVVAAIASTSATLAGAWQLEAAAPGGAVLGAALAILPLLALARPGQVAGERLPLSGLLAGLALAYEPLVGVMAVASCGALLGTAWSPALRGETRRLGWRTAGAMLAGLSPLALGFLLRGRALSLNVPPFSQASAAPGGVTVGGLLGFLHAELGWTSAILAAAGLAVALTTRAARPLAVAVAVLAAVGILGGPLGPTRYGSAPLAGLGALMVLAGVAMQTVVRAVAAAPLPLASASAAMIVVLELTFPVLAADDGLQRWAQRLEGAPVFWNEAVLSALPPGPVLLVRDRLLMARLLASRAAGELRGDLTLVPFFDLAGSLAARALASEPKLAPLWRDLLLSGAPDELGLSTLSQVRPVALAFEPRWPRPLARHLVPVGELAVFEPEPRGTSDRQRALDTGTAARTRLARLLGREPELVRLTASLVRARALTLAWIGERELANRALDELRPLAPGDKVTVELARRMAGGPPHAPVDVADLVP